MSVLPGHEGKPKLLIVLIAIPAIALISLLGLALIDSGGQPAGIVINNVFGEEKVNETPAREFALELFNGGTLHLSDLRGKVVMIDFWSSWCPPCKAEAILLSEVYDSFQGSPVEFVGIAVWDSQELASGFVQRSESGYPNGLDGRGLIAIDYGVRGIPEKFFLDSNGNVVKKFVGPITKLRLTQVLDEMVLRIGEN